MGNAVISEGWPEDKADWPHAVGVVQGGVVPAHGKTRQVTVEQLAKLQERCDELLKQRDELLSALVSYGHKSGCEKNAFGAECTCGIDAVISSVKGGAA